MNLKLITLTTLSICTFVGCASMTPEAQNVVVHTQASTLLDDCERLGTVSSTVSDWSKWDRSQSIQQAKNNVRHEAYVRYGADTVAIVNADNYMTSATIQAIAFKCNK